VALECFIDNIATTVIEDKLISQLSDILSPIKVTLMAANLMNSIAGETKENCAERE
jgi:hypothetical protein